MIRALATLLGVAIALGMTSIVWVPCAAVLAWIGYACWMALR